jgi:CBS domain-containing protein
VTEFRKITPTNLTEENVMPETLTTLAFANRLEIDRNPVARTAVSVQSVVSDEPQTVPAKASLEEVFALAARTPQEVLLVVDSQGGYVGALATRDLVALLIYDRELRDLVNAYDLARPQFPSIAPQSNLEDALHVMEDELIGALPVVDPERPRELKGLVTREEIAQVFSRK